MKSFILLTVLASVPHASGALVAYWNFNDLTTTAGLPSNVNQTSYTPTSGTATLSLTGWTSRGGTTSPWGITNFAGSAVNALNADLPLQSLAVEASNATTGTPNNGAALVLQFDMTGLENPILTFASRNTGTGFNNNQVAWSTDGTNYTNFNTYALTTTFALQTFDFTATDALDNTSTAFIRINFLGATGNSGNNRLDNIQINAAAAVPEPSSAPLLAGLFLLPCRRRRA